MAFSRTFSLFVYLCIYLFFCSLRSTAYACLVFHKTPYNKHIPTHTHIHMFINVNPPAHLIQYLTHIQITHSCDIREAVKNVTEFVYGAQTTTTKTNMLQWRALNCYINIKMRMKWAQVQRKGKVIKACSATKDRFSCWI